MQECVKIPLSKGRGHALISPEDYKRVSQYKWFLDNTGYVKCTSRINSNRQMKLHQFILQVPVGTEIDHINGSKVDNSRENLRAITHQQNCQNSRGPHMGIKGASYRKRDGKWAAKITIDGKLSFIGYYTTQEDAALAYDSAALFYFKEFARVNYPDMDTTPYSLDELRDLNRKNTSSQFRGVCFYKSSGKWQAGINIKGKNKHLGYFDNEEDAAKAFDEATLKYRGEKAKLNFPGGAP